MCMYEDGPFEDFLRRLKSGGLDFVMTNPPKIVKFVSTTNIHQSLWTKGPREEREIV